MCAGLPVITTPVGGIPGIFKDGEHGIFVPPRNSEELADAMISIAEDFHFRKTVSENVIEYVEANHDINVVWGELVSVLEGKIPDLNQ
jgi:glycosyltransferase involved in cell wall biosynthesis